MNMNVKSLVVLVLIVIAGYWLWKKV